MKSLARYVVLPREITPFERDYLARTNRRALFFFLAHLPALIVLAWVNGTGPATAAILGSLLVAGPALAYFTMKNPRSVSVVYGVTAMGMGGLLVHLGQGPLQIEMHFYFFALIAMLAIFGNPTVIMAATVTVALHHLLLWGILPASVFNYGAPIWVVGVHAGFVVFEAIGAIYIARSFFDNVIGLESVVQSRTCELRRRQEEMRLVLDNVDQGFVGISRGARMSEERSASFDAWFSPDTTGTLFDLFERLAPAFGADSRGAWEQVTDDVLPLELTLGQMPAVLEFDGRIFDVSYRAIGVEPTPDRFLVVVADITAARAAARADLERREQQLMIEKMQTDRALFVEFFDEGSALVGSIVAGTADSDLCVLKRAIHTLKGNAGFAGLSSIVDACHDIESWMANEGCYPAEHHLDRLRLRWAELSAGAEKLLGARRHVIEIDEGTHASLESAVRQRTARRALLRMVYDLRLERTERRLGSFAELVQRTAMRLGKEVDVRCHGGDLRLDARHWAPFWGAFVHAVRNAADHGIESADLRAAAGKPAIARIDISTRVEGTSFVVEISDDGAGVQWERIAERARIAGLPHATPEDLELALFAGGITTAAEVTNLSGRGVGMSALHAATLARGGRIEMRSRPGRGTDVRFVFPAASMSPDFVDLVSVAA